MFAPNLPEWALVFHATAGLGAALTPCALSLTDEELAFQLADSGASVLITVPALVGRARRAIAAAAKRGKSKSQGVSGGDASSATAAEKAEVALFVIGAAADADSFGTLLQHGSIDWDDLDDAGGCDDGDDDDSAGEYDVGGRSRSSGVLMPAELPALLSYYPIGDGKLGQDVVTHADLLKVFYPDVVDAVAAAAEEEKHAGKKKEKKKDDDDDSERAEAGSLKLQFGSDVLLGMLPFWRLDCFLGVVLAAAFQFCTVVTVDRVDALSIGKIVADAGVTVLPATGKMMRMIADVARSTAQQAETKDATVQPPISSLRRVVCLSDRKEDSGEEANAAMSALLTSWKALCKHQVTAHAMDTMTALGATLDPTPIEYPSDKGGSEYVMPAFFRRQTSATKEHATSHHKDRAREWRSAAQDGGYAPDLFVTTDITLVGGQVNALSPHDVVSVLLESGGPQLVAQVRPNGITVEASGPWRGVFDGLARCHDLAHSFGPSAAIHTTMSLSSSSEANAGHLVDNNHTSSSSSSGGADVDADADAAVPPRTPMAGTIRAGAGNQNLVRGRARTSSSSSNNSSGRGNSTSIGTPMSPEMREMHASLQIEEEKIRAELQRQRVLKNKLDEARASAAKIAAQNFDLEDAMQSVGDASESERKRRTLRRVQGSGHSPRNSWSGSDFDSRSLGKGGSDGGGGGGGGSRRQSGSRGSGSTSRSSFSYDATAAVAQVGGEAVAAAAAAAAAAARARAMASAQPYSTEPGSMVGISDSDVLALEAALGMEETSPVRESEVVYDDEVDGRDDDSDGDESMLMRDEEESSLKDELEEDMRRLLQKGVTLFGENKADQAKPLFEEVVRIARDLGNQAVEGRAVGNLASVFEATGRHHDAIDLYMQCVDILKQVGDSRKEARILYNVSHSYLSLEKYDEAIDFLNQSLALTDDDATRSAVEQQLAVVRHAMIQQGAEEDDRIMDF